MNRRLSSWSAVVSFLSPFRHNFAENGLHDLKMVQKDASSNSTQSVIIKTLFCIQYGSREGCTRVLLGPESLGSRAPYMPNPHSPIAAPEQIIYYLTTSGREQASEWASTARFFLPFFEPIFVRTKTSGFFCVQRYLVHNMPYHRYNPMVWGTGHHMHLIIRYKW
jgi:hypothetical protein